MKGKNLKTYISSAFVFLFVVSVYSQNGNGSNYASKEDSIQCLKDLSAYREFVRLNIYEYAIDPWKAAFDKCRASSEKMYVDGVTLYRSFIEETPDGPVREGLIDTLMLIYDRRIENFGGEGNVLGRKGRDLLNYRGEDLEEVENAYEMLKKSIEIEGTKSKEATILLLISSGIKLNKAEQIDDGQVIEDYFSVIMILDKLEGRSSRWEKTRAQVDELMLREDILSCEALDSYYEPQFAQSKDDKEFLEKVINFYKTSGCEGSDIFAVASEELYEIEPGPESAHNLAILFISKGDFPRAIDYLKMAVVGENLEKETLAEWFYELSVVSSANEDYCEAIKYAREAILNKSDYGKAYMILGDAIIYSRNNLGDDFEQRAAFWLAADKYSKAASLDASLKEEANQKLNDYARQYPNSEEVFFRDMKDGDTYQLKGCINESTTVRARK